MSDPMLGQVQSFRESADKAEWQVAHAEAMACRYLEQLIVLGMNLYRAQEELVLLWKSKRDPDMARVRELEAVWRAMGAAFDVLLRSIRAAEKLGYRVERADEFRAICGELGAMLSLTIERIQLAEEQIRQGRTRPLAEVEREIRR
jgi:hypothetical protein